MKLIDCEPLINSLSKMQTELGYDAITIHGIIKALKEMNEVQFPKLDRKMWTGCEYCMTDLDGYSAFFRDKDGKSRNLYMPEGKAEIVVSIKRNQDAYIPISYCPFCGKPLKAEAWAELERRIGGNHEVD